MSDFTKVQRPHGDCWLHKSETMWIVRYPEKTRGGDTINFYQAYRLASWVSASEVKNRDPWTLDNRRFNDTGFTSLDAAMQAVRTAA